MLLININNTVAQNFPNHKSVKIFTFRSSERFTVLACYNIVVASFKAKNKMNKLTD